MPITILPVILTLTLGDAVSLRQTNNVPADALIQLRRTSCFGTCPVYSVSIDATGQVIYVGEKFVRVVGRHTARIEPSIVAKLLAHAESARFFDLRDAYREIENADGSRTSVSDQPTTFVSVAANGRNKTIEDYIGAPEALKEFEREIDEAAGSKRWISLDGRE